VNQDTKNNVLFEIKKGVTIFISIAFFYAQSPKGLGWLQNLEFLS